MEKLSTVNFVSNYINRISDKMAIGGDQPCVTYRVEPTDRLLELAGFRKQEADPYDDFDYYIECEIAVSPDGKIHLLVGDNFETREWELDGDLSEVNKLIAEYEAN